MESVSRYSYRPTLRFVPSQPFIVPWAYPLLESSCCAFRVGGMSEILPEPSPPPVRILEGGPGGASSGPVSLLGQPGPILGVPLGSLDRWNGHHIASRRASSSRRHRRGRRGDAASSAYRRCPRLRG